MTGKVSVQVLINSMKGVSLKEPDKATQREADEGAQRQAQLQQRGVFDVGHRALRAAPSYGPGEPSLAKTACCNVRS